MCNMQQHSDNWIRKLQGGTLGGQSRMYGKLKEKCKLVSLDLEFLSKCKKSGILPNFIRNKFPKLVDDPLKLKLMQTTLKWECQFKY